MSKRSGDTEYSFPELASKPTRKTARTELPKPPPISGRRPIREVIAESNRPKPPELTQPRSKALSEAKLLREEVDNSNYVPKTTLYGSSK
jgi:hypothetical protein